MLIFIAIALLVDAALQLGRLISQIMTHLLIELGKAGLYGFPCAITSYLWSVQLLLLFKYTLRQATTRRLVLP